MAFNFDYYSPTEVVFGRKTEEEVGVYLKKYGASRVLVVYGSERVRKNGLMKTIEDQFPENNIVYSFLGGVVPNPRLDKVYEGITKGKQISADFILAVGGGSVIDTAKAIAYGIAEPESDVWSLYDGSRQAVKCMPVGVVLTIAAAGSETSMGSVITDDRTKEKRAYDDNLARPKFAIMNPELTMSLPDYQTEAGATDVMMHTMERYFTQGGNMDVTDTISEGLLRNVMRSAKILHRNPQNYDQRAELMWSGSISHNGLTDCGTDGGDWSTHMLEHELSGAFDVTHGAGLAAIWPSWANYVLSSDLSRFVKFAQKVIGVTDEGTSLEVAKKGIQGMIDFYHEIGMPANIMEMGISLSDEQCRMLAKGCANAAGGIQGSAKKLSEEDMYNIYKNASTLE